MKASITSKFPAYNVYTFRGFKEMTSSKTRKFGGNYSATIKNIDHYSAAIEWAKTRGYKGYNVKQESANKRKSTYYYIVRFYDQPVSQYGLPRIQETFVWCIRITKKTKA